MALAAAPGVALADDGTGSRATKSDSPSAHEASPSGRHQTRAATAAAGAWKLTHPKLGPWEISHWSLPEIR